MVPYLDSLEPLGLRCCVRCVWCGVVCCVVVWCDKVWCGVIKCGGVGQVKGMHFSQ